jgi:hypothetical protein
VTAAEIHTAYINAVSDRFGIFIGRRIAFGETLSELIAEVDGPISEYVRADIK